MERFLLTNVPTLWLGVGMVVVAVALALLGLVLVRRSVDLNKFESHHEVAGFIIAVVGVIYAVILAFVVVIQWEQFRGAEDDARAEANAIGNLYRDGVAVGGTQGSALEKAVSSYATYVVNTEWAYMGAHQTEAPGTDEYRNGMWLAVIKLPTQTAMDADVARQAVGDVSAAAEARRTRVEDSSTSLPTPLWVVLILGGVITIGFTYFFGLKRFLAQALMVSTLAAIIGLSLVVILTLDLPFTGDVAAEPTALIDEMNEFCSYNFVIPTQAHNCQDPPSHPGDQRRAETRSRSPSSRVGHLAPSPPPSPVDGVRARPSRQGM